MRAAFDAQEHPDRLNLGCGWDIRDGFLNVDLHEFHQPQLVADVTDLSMLPSDSYVEIVAQDVLEHLPRQNTVDVLREWSRLLRPGGTLELRIPSVLGVARLLQSSEFQTIAQQELMVQCLFGTQAYTEDCHYTTFTEPLLRHYLAEAGLEPTEFVIRDGWLFEVIAKKLAPGAESNCDPFGSAILDTGRFAGDMPDDPSDGTPPPTRSRVSAVLGHASPLARRVLRRGRAQVRAVRRR